MFAVYTALMIAGSWLIPLATSYVPHDPAGTDELTQTRAYRGRVASAIALGHLYHLEHHLYPAVPHQHWPELARRLDPYLARPASNRCGFGFKGAMGLRAEFGWQEEFLSSVDTLGFRLTVIDRLDRKSVV